MKDKAACTTLSAIILSAAAGMACAQAPVAAGVQAPVDGVAAAPEAHARQAAEFAATMTRHRIPGAQLVYCHQDACTEYDHGVTGNRPGEPVTARTLFQAASLSKVVAAYIALRLVDQGRLDLDTPLHDYWPSPRTRDNEAARRITTRMVLNHTTGLPNWQISPSNPALDDTPLASDFAPGSRFQYSGEGFYLLQKTLEHVTGTAWNDLAKKEVFARFNMPASSFVTDPAFDALEASGHDPDGTPLADRVFARANTAWTLVTNAHDYANFVQGALYRGEGLQPATHAMMLAESSDADDRAVPTPADPFVSWGLGVGRQVTGPRTLIWHWGDNPGFKALFALDPASGDSVVLFTNSENGLATYKDVLRLFLGPGDYPAVDWASAQS